MNPLLIIGGLYLVFGLWTFDWIGRRDTYRNSKEMLLGFLYGMSGWWIILPGEFILPKIKVPERYRVRKK